MQPASNKFLRIAQTLFKYKFHCFRNTDFNRIFDISKGIPLPYDCIIHELGELKLGQDILPELNKFDKLFNFNNKYFIYHNNPLIEEDFHTYKFPDKQFSVLSAGMSSKISKFRTENMERLRPVSNINMLDNIRKEFIALINNRTLGNVRMTGLLLNERFIEYMLGGTLDKIIQLPTNISHYIPIELPKTTYKRSDFLPIMKRGFSPSSIMHKNDPFYILISHLVCHSELSEIKSIFDIIPKIEPKDEKDIPIQHEEQISFIFYNEKYFCIYSIKNLLDKLNQGISYFDRFINQLNRMIDLDETIQITDSELDDNLLDENVNIDTNVNEVISSKSDNKENEKIDINSSPVINPKNIDTSSNNPSVSNDTQEKEDEIFKKGALDKNFDIPNFEIKAKDKKSSEINNRYDIEPIVETSHFPKVKEKINHTSPLLKTENYLDKEVYQLIERVGKDYTDKQKQRLIENVNKWKELTIAEEPIYEIMNKHNGLEPIVKKDLSFLENEVADKSLLNLTTTEIDKQYTDKLYKKHIIGSVLHLNKSGMFLTDVKVKDFTNKLEDYSEYTFKFEDLNFKQHSFKVILPNIQEDGTLISRGSIKKIYKQRINKPIVKISPTTVSLFSDYNKYQVELVSPARGNILGIVNNYLLKKNKDRVITFSQGKFIDNNRKYPLELSQLASGYSWIKFHNTYINFNLKELNYDENIKAYEIGTSSDAKLFINMKNEILIFRDNKLIDKSYFIKIFASVLNIPEVHINQWTELNIISKQFPIGIILAYRYGLENMLKEIKLDYDVYQRDDKNIPKDSRLIKVKLNDVTIVAEPFPYYRSFIFNGLNKFDLSKYSLADLNEKETYYDVFSNEGYSPNYLLEINNFFDFFVDPVTYEVLLESNEPTTPEGILIRCNELLQTAEHIPNSSVKNFRVRTHGKIPALLYNELTKQMAMKRRPINQNSKFSINPQAVFQRIMQDALTENADINNPLGAIKDMTTFSYTGWGGRSAESFVVKDRQFPKDGIGIISEATVDSSNVAIRAQYSMNASITNLNGIEEPKDINEVEPSDMLSITALLFPATTQDDKWHNNAYCPTH